MMQLSIWRGLHASGLRQLHSGHLDEIANWQIKWQQPAALLAAWVVFNLFRASVLPAGDSPALAIMNLFSGSVGSDLACT